MNNKVEVGVLYADLSRVIVPYAEKDTLSLVAVLALVVRDNAVEGKKRNITAKWGYDNYALCEGIENGQPWVEIYPWDNGDYVRRRMSNHLDVDARVMVDVPLGCMHMIFRGQDISDADWVEALRILEKEIL
ncbi:MAG: hypothetical protein O7D34_02245 [Ignavibacteria bacterium]|nr:hypothetical protein [Ignavibacteria bacterium]